MNTTMTTEEAIKYVVVHFGITSMYQLAKSLSDETLNVQPIQISNYMHGTRMSQKVADRFFETYGIVIGDAHATGVFQR